MRIQLLAAATILTALAACAGAPSITVPDVPAALRPPADQTVYLEALASGVQIYRCVQKADGGYAWSFEAPEASLASPAGERLGKHYAGPTWEATDGSAVVGEVKAKDPGPTPTAIPWLLLAAKTNRGEGVFGTARSIQRLSTRGGIAPAEPCGTANLRQVARIPYTATYYFYR